MLDGIDRTFKHLTPGSEIHNSCLVATLEQSREEVRVDLSLELRNTPISELRLDLVERALRRVRHLRQRAVVRPAQPAREASERGSGGDRTLESGRNITSLVMFSWDGQ